MAIVERQVLGQLEVQLDIVFRPASAADVQILIERNWPAKVISFYASSDPHEVLEKTRPKMRLYSIREIIWAMTTLEPSITMAPWGYGTFAQNRYGDAYMYNFNAVDAEGWPEILFADHEMLIGLSEREEMEALLGEVAKNLPTFLQMLAKGKIE